MADLSSLTSEEFRRLAEFLYRRTGMVFTEAKALLRGTSDFGANVRHNQSFIYRLLRPSPR